MVRGVAVVLLALGAVGQAVGQDRPENEGWGLVVGAGGLLAPTYEGDDSYRLSVVPNIQVSYEDVFFASVQEGVGYRVINDETLRAGPIARIKFSRSEDGDQPFAITGEDTQDLLGLDDVETSFELGGFVEYEIGSITLSAEARQAVSGHDGFVADFGARWSGTTFALGPPLIWSIGPRMRVVDDGYNDAYFTVSPAEAAASGLSAFQASGGVHSYGIGATAILPLTRDNSWTAVMFAGYDRLAGDAGASSLVQERGSEDQATVGLFLSYTAF